MHEGLNPYTEWLQSHVCDCLFTCVEVHVWMCFYKFVFVSLPLSLCVLQSLCQDCTTSWSHPIIKHIQVISRYWWPSSGCKTTTPPHISLSLSLSGALLGKLLIGGKRKQGQIGGWMERQIDESCLIWLTDWLTQWIDDGWLASWLVAWLWQWHTDRHAGCPADWWGLLVISHFRTWTNH